MITDKQKRQLDRLAQALADVSPERLDTLTRKTERIGIRVTPTDKADMEATAAALGLGLTEYLTALHFYAADKLRTRTGKKREG